MSDSDQAVKPKDFPPENSLETWVVKAYEGSSLEAIEAKVKSAISRGCSLPGRLIAIRIASRNQAYELELEFVDPVTREQLDIDSFPVEKKGDFEDYQVDKGRPLYQNGNNTVPVKIVRISHPYPQ